MRRLMYTNVPIYAYEMYGDVAVAVRHRYCVYKYIIPTSNIEICIITARQKLIDRSIDRAIKRRESYLYIIIQVRVCLYNKT